RVGERLQVAGHRLGVGVLRLEVVDGVGAAPVAEPVIGVVEGLAVPDGGVVDPLGHRRGGGGLGRRPRPAPRPPPTRPPPRPAAPRPRPAGGPPAGRPARPGPSSGGEAGRSGRVLPRRGPGAAPPRGRPPARVRVSWVASLHGRGAGPARPGFRRPWLRPAGGA